MVNRVSEPVVNFERSIAWQKAQDLAVIVYAVTKKFPAEEKFALASQLRRAVNSVSANIAEGFGRRAPKDKKHFYTMAYGSLLETKNYIYLADRLTYLDAEEFTELKTATVNCQKLINGLMRSLNASQNSPEY